MNIMCKICEATFDSSEVIPVSFTRRVLDIKENGVCLSCLRELITSARAFCTPQEIKAIITTLQ
jgi:hypothetical protein